MAEEKGWRPVEKLPCEVFMKMAQKEVKQLRAQVKDMEECIKEQNKTAQAREERIRFLERELVKEKQLVETYKAGVKDTSLFKDMQSKYERARNEARKNKDYADSLLVEITKMRQRNGSK